MWSEAQSGSQQEEFLMKEDIETTAGKKPKPPSSDNKEDLSGPWTYHFRIGGMDITVEFPEPFSEEHFKPNFLLFRRSEPGEAPIHLKHHFYIPELKTEELGKELYKKPPWQIFQKEGRWIYKGISLWKSVVEPHSFMIFNEDYTRGEIYSRDLHQFRKGNLNSLSFFNGDQLFLSHLLARREGCLLHSSGAIMNGHGLLFIGHSDAGKSTTVSMLKDKVEILSDERNILRREGPGNFRLYGSWMHSDYPVVSPASAPLRAVFFIEKAPDNRLVRLTGAGDIMKRFLSCIIKPFVTTDWWESQLSLVEHIIQEVPCYILRLDKSGKVVQVLEEFLGEEEGPELGSEEEAGDH